MNPRSSVRPLGRTAATGAFDAAASPFGMSQLRASVAGAPEPRSPTPIAEPVFPRPARRPNHDWRLIVLVFLPFSVGYYLSYLFRTINALISAQLTSDLALGAADLGLLTSVYFLTFAAAQLPIGVLLDRYGPRRIQSVLLGIAAVGSTLFAVSDHFLMLLVGRALIGLGVASAMTAGLKALVLWFPGDRVPLLNG